MVAPVNKGLYLQIENLKYPEALEMIPRKDWPPLSKLAEANKPFEVWRSRTFFIMIYMDRGFERLSMLRTEFSDNTGRFSDGVSWDDMQRLKAECGRGSRWAVEVYPPDAEIVNVQNMRH